MTSPNYTLEIAAAREEARARVDVFREHIARLRRLVRYLRKRLEAVVPMLPAESRAQTVADVAHLQRSETSCDNMEDLANRTDDVHTDWFDKVAKHRLALDPHLAGALQLVDDHIRSTLRVLHFLWSIDGSIWYQQLKRAGLIPKPGTA